MGAQRGYNFFRDFKGRGLYPEGGTIFSGILRAGVYTPFV